MVGSVRSLAADAATPAFAELRDGVGYFTGRGGTIGWLVNREIALIVDTQFPETIGACLDGLRERAGRQIDLALNTHHHPDHTSGNPALGPRGIRRIVGHENVPQLLRDQAVRRNLTTPPVAPNETFSQRWRLEAGSEVIAAQHFGAAHTGGDILVHFERANVVHVGDVVFNQLHPVIDRPGGAHIRNWINVLELAAAQYPADASYLCGHGRDGVVAERSDLLVMRDYLAKLLETVEGDLTAGRTLEQIKQRAALDGFEDFGGATRLPNNLEAAYLELTGAPVVR